MVKNIVTIMRIFPIYESLRLFNRKVRALSNCEADACNSEYLSLSLDGIHLVICFHRGYPLNLRVFTDLKEYNKFISNVEKSYKSYDKNKEEHTYCVYPDPKENIPF